LSSFFEKNWLILFILMLAVLAGMAWGNYRYVEANPGGNDFLVHWEGTRSLLVDGLSPYSDEVAIRIQKLAYGRPARSGEHELRVAYPLYAEAFFLPFAFISDYNLARAAWMTLLEGGLVVLAFLSLRLTEWKPGILTLTAFLLFSIFWYHGLRPLINGNAVILVALLIAGAFMAIKTGRDELAGITLALSTIKPHLVVLLIAFVVIWAISTGRWKIVIWFSIAMVLLIAGAMVFVPDWPLQNLAEILRYPSYNPPGTPGAVFSTWFPASGSKLGWGLTVFLGILLLIEWFLARGRDFRWFLWTACLTLVVSQWIGIETDPGNFIILFIPLVLVFAVWEERWGARGRLVILILMMLLFVGLWALFLKTVVNNGQPQQHPIMFFPLPLFLLIGLYWIRWWAIRPTLLLIDALREYERL
jgi:hypothetical protein